MRCDMYCLRATLLDRLRRGGGLLPKQKEAIHQQIRMLMNSEKNRVRYIEDMAKAHVAYCHSPKLGKEFPRIPNCKPIIRAVGGNVSKIPKPWNRANCKTDPKKPKVMSAGKAKGKAKAKGKGKGKGKAKKGAKAIRRSSTDQPQ